MAGLWNLFIVSWPGELALWEQYDFLMGEDVGVSLGFSHDCSPSELMAEHWDKVRSLKWWVSSIRETQITLNVYATCIRASQGETIAGSAVLAVSQVI